MQGKPPQILLSCRHLVMLQIREQLGEEGLGSGYEEITILDDDQIRNPYI
jgi:hypothetical protein